LETETGYSEASTRVTSGPVSALPQPETLTPRQSARRERVLQVAIELAETGGYEAVQMRDVANRAGVALGTVYRYFSSKDQLLASAFAAWAADLEGRLNRRPLRGSTRADKVIDFVHRATRPFERRPELAGALVTSLTSRDPHAAEAQRDVAAWMTRIVAATLEGMPPDETQGICEVVGHVWYSTLLSWVNGRIETSRMYEILDSACRLLLDPREPVS
jgi:AcrR family transcriptional regulator